PRRLDYSKDFAYVTSREPRIALRPLPVSGRAEFHHEVFKRRMSRVALEPSVVAAADQLASGNTAEFLDLIANALRTAAARGEQPSLHHVDAVGKRRGEELRRLVVGGGALREFQALARDGSLEELAAPWLGVRAVVEDGDAATLRIHPGLATEIAAKETQD
ncbi:MAG: hypothetical protein KC492_09155, partial [Myxococcales bacterium]|nr:hypothetical protein [Myxococcales bacterium]